MWFWFQIKCHFNLMRIWINSNGGFDSNDSFKFTDGGISAWNRGYPQQSRLWYDRVKTTLNSFSWHRQTCIPHIPPSLRQEQYCKKLKRVVFSSTAGSEMIIIGINSKSNSIFFLIHFKFWTNSTGRIYSICGHHSTLQINMSVRTVSWLVLNYWKMYNLLPLICGQNSCRGVNPASGANSSNWTGFKRRSNSRYSNPG